MATPAPITKHFPINATTADKIVVPVDPARRFIYIKNYSTSSVTIFIAFGQVATPGQAGELEITPGTDYFLYGPLQPPTQTLPQNFFLPHCPFEEIHAICSGGTATGCVVTQ